VKAVEKVKAQKAVDKIQSGEFDESDVEMLFLRLRAYSGEHKIFRESADFVAHNDVRNKGLTVSSLDNFYLSLRFFCEYSGDNAKKLDISKEFPSYVKKLLKYQAVNCDQDDFKSRLKMSSQKAISIIDNVFREDTVKKTCTLKDGRVSDSKLAVLNQLLSFIKVDSVFTPEQFMDDLYGVLKKNGIQYAEEKVELNKSKILLSFGLLLHMADFKLTGGGKAKCLLGCEGAWQPDDTLANEDRFGKLSIFGHCEIAMGDNPVTVIYNVFDTGLQASDYCGALMFKPELHPQLSDVSGTKLDLERPLQMIDGLLVPI
jgi:hypothetical protein